MNSEEEHRCVRCGRRLRDGSARPTLDTYPIQTATAPKLAQWTRPEPLTSPPPGADPARSPLAYQRPLFQEMPRVLPVPVEPRPASPRAGRVAPRRRRNESQHAFDFNPRQPAGAPVADIEPGIYCDAPVALLAHRALASIIDGGIVVAAMAAFLLTFSFAGGDFVLNRSSLVTFGAAAALLMILYRLLFAMGNGDTPGYRWARLRLLNFDGQQPSRRERIGRLIGGCLSIAASGLGLLWALVDEETLTWHDHISRTFPTPDLNAFNQ